MFKRKIFSEESIEKTIRECPLFKGLSHSELKASLKIAHIREYASDEKVFTEGTVGLCFYVIAKGKVEIISDSVTPNKNKVIKEYVEGGYFSETHLFAESNHTVSCVAKELTKLIIFAKPDFEDLIKIKPNTGNKLLLNFLEFMGSQLEVLYKENHEMKERLIQLDKN
jgi:CRP-like cAMP-binding protein